MGSPFSDANVWPKGWSVCPIEISDGAWVTDGLVSREDWDLPLLMPDLPYTTMMAGSDIRASLDWDGLEQIPVEVTTDGLIFVTIPKGTNELFVARGPENADVPKADRGVWDDYTLAVAGGDVWRHGVRQ